MEKQPRERPYFKIGMRTVKTLIASYICFLIGWARGILPFYSVIAAILCLQKEKSQGFTVGMTRMVGTLIGGAFGLVAMLLYRQTPFETFAPLHYLYLTLFLVPVIYTNLKLRDEKSVYISCVVFLSITVSHGGDTAPVMFTLHRILETLIGITVSVAINHLLGSPPKTT